MKKNGGVLAFLTVMLSSLVSAGPVEGVQQLAEGAREMIMVGVRFISSVIFDLNAFNELLFAKILILLIIFFVVFSVLDKNSIFGIGVRLSDKKITIIISSAISILSVRYLPNNFVEAILLQYSAFAVGITTLLPLLIFFFFIHQSGVGSFGRKSGWALYGIALGALTAFIYSDLGAARYLYWIGIIIVIVAFLFDKPIHAQFNLSDIRNQRKEQDLQRYHHNLKRIKEMKASLDTGLTGNVKIKTEKSIKKLERENEKMAKNF